MKNTTRLFYTVDQKDYNREIFETMDEAIKFIKTIPKSQKPSLLICEVNNYFQEADGSWNYDDYSDTFKEIVIIDFFNN